MAQSEIFVMFDALCAKTEVFNHVPGGSNVLFLDGHVVFIKYPGRAPVTAAIATPDGAFLDFCENL
ncbi:MAG TPA: hypothetical protein ENN80_13240 [Candidatus Hydrogenedentes bacterium]|nr:hypothetical protein [Candidatus Hydrogenedentota bacterium]